MSPLRTQRVAVGAAFAIAALVLVSPSSGSTALEKANAAVGSGQYDLAIKELGGATGQERQAALLLKAKLELKVGKLDDALETAAALAALGKDGRALSAPVRARALAAQGKTREAIAAVKEVADQKGAHAARVVLGELLLRTGHRAEAKPILQRVLEAYEKDEIASSDGEALGVVGRACQLVGRKKSANKVFGESERASRRTLVDPMVWRAELFLDAHDPGNAGASLKDARKIAPKDPDVLALLAAVSLENTMDFEGAEADVDQALQVNPRHAGAHFIRAGLALRDLDLTKADAAADAGLVANPNDLELLSMKAAIRFLADDLPGFEALKQKVLGLNPEFTRFHSIVGEYAEWEHRYAAIVTLMREAVKLDDNDGKAWATLGMNLVRMGEEREGLEALQRSFKKDPFNVRAYNSLNLYEKTIPESYVSVEGAKFRIRYPKDDKPLLERYVPRMLDEAWKGMAARYGFTPKTPVQIEIYRDAEHFSIRTSGLPNVGIQGVAFGQTLAALSPAQPFNWGNVLWHELGHVFAIQQSKSHVPRWFTEGLSEYEAIVRRPEWRREEDPALYLGLRAGRIPSVNGFNSSFTHVDSAEEVTMAYYAASQLVVFMVERYGFPRVVSMLPKWGEGKRTPEVVKEALGTTSEDLDREFRAWIKPRLARYERQFVPDMHPLPVDVARRAVKADPTNAKKRYQLAVSLQAEGQEDEGRAALADALKADPKQPDSNYVLAVLAVRNKDLAGARARFEKMIADGNDGYVVRMRLADLAEARGEEAAMVKQLEAASALDPTQVEPLQGLVDVAHKKKDGDAELAALRKLAALDQHDRRVWERLLSALVQRGQWDEARKVGESALFVDLENPEIHRLYARALARTGHPVSAIYELNSAVLCGPNAATKEAIYREMARGYTKLGEAGFAKQAGAYASHVASQPKGAEPLPKAE